MSPSAKIWIGLGVATVVAAGAWVSSAKETERLLSAELDGVFDYAASVGMATRQEELKTPIPDEQNAVIPLETATRAIVSKVKHWENGIVNGPDHFLYARSVAQLKKIDNELDDVVHALMRPGWFDDYDRDQPFSRSSAGRFVYPVELLRNRCYLRAITGDAKGCLSDFRAARRFGQHLAKQQDPSDQSTAIANEHRLMSLACLLGTMWAKNEVLRFQLATLIEETSFSVDPRLGFRGKMYETLAWMRNFEVYGGMSYFTPDFEAKRIDPKLIKRTGLPTGRFERAQLSYTLQCWADLLKFMGDGSEPEGGWEYAASQTPYYGSPYDERFNYECKLETPSNGSHLQYAEHKMVVAMTVAMLKEISDVRPRNVELPIPDVFAPGQFVKLECVDGHIAITSAGYPTLHSIYDSPLEFNYPMPKSAVGL